MANMFLILSLMINSHAALIATAHISYQPVQDNRPLSLKQIEQMIEGGFNDEVVAREISERGLAFRLPAATFEQLIKRGAGDQTKRALLRHEERVAYDAYNNEKQDAVKRLALGKEYLRRHQRSERAAVVEAGIRKSMFDVFNAESNSFNANPDAKSLERLITMGREILSQDPGRAIAVQVTSQLALATGRGMLGNFYSNLEQSRAYADQALNLLEESTPPPDLDAESYARLRANSHSLLYQVQGLYLLRQQTPDPEQAIGYLTSAAESKDGPSAKDPNTYWLRALARDLIYQKHIEEYRAMSKGIRVGKQGKALCGKINPIADQLFDDYIRVIELSRATGSVQLSDEARAALKSLSSTDRPCLAGRIELLDELPAEENRFALVIGVEDYQDQRIGKNNFASSDARAVAGALAQYAGFRKDRIVLLATGEERQPMRSAILQQLASLSERFSRTNQTDDAKGTTEDGFLLIYFSGHNIVRGGKNYLLPADALTTNDTLLAETAISVERIKELIRASGASQVMLVFDAFRQEPLNEAFTRELTFDTRNQEVTAFATLLATSVGKRSYESQSKKQSLFTAALIEGLKGRAAGGGREVTLDRLVKYLQTSVSSEAADQRPLAIIEGYQSDELALAVSDGGNPSRASSAKPDPTELIRAAKTIYVRSNTIFLRSKLLEDELLKLPDFKRLGLKIVSDLKDADLVVDVTLPFLTWTWTYVVSHHGANTQLANGKIREITAGPASIRLAKDIVTRLHEVRAPVAPRQ